MAISKRAAEYRTMAQVCRERAASADSPAEREQLEAKAASYDRQAVDAQNRTDRRGERRRGGTMQGAATYPDGYGEQRPAFACEVMECPFQTDDARELEEHEDAHEPTRTEA